MGFCVSGGGRVVETIFELGRAGVLTLHDPVVLLDKPSAFAEVAAAYGVRVEIVDRSRYSDRETFREALQQELLSLPVDGLFLTFDWLLPPAVVRRYQQRIVNLHMSLLPLFPGRKAVDAALRSGMGFAGVTYHLVDEGMDTGPIIAQGVANKSPEETVDSLGQKLFFLAARLGPQVLKWLIEGNVTNVSKHRAIVRNANYGEGPFSPSINREIDELTVRYLASRFPVFKLE